mgnify:FL=1
MVDSDFHNGDGEGVDENDGYALTMTLLFLLGMTRGRTSVRRNSSTWF